MESSCYCGVLADGSRMLLEDVSASVTSLQVQCKDKYSCITFLLLSDYPHLKHLRIGAKSLQCVELFEAVDHGSIESIEVGYECCLGSTGVFKQYGSFSIRNRPNLTSLILGASSFENYGRFELKSGIGD